MISHILFATNEIITNDYSINHQAIDVVGENRNMDDIISYEDGTVVLVVDNLKKNDTSSKGTKSYGNFIKIKHDNNIQTLYAHLKYGSIKVKKGDKIKKGQIIAKMGNTGKAYGTHLHFEIMDYKNNRKNPHDYLQKENNSATETKTNEVQENVLEEKEEIKTTEKINNINIDEKTNDEKTNKKESDIESEKASNLILNENIDISTNNDSTLFENYEYKYLSLSDALNEIYVNNDFEYRKLLAEKNNILNYTGTNIQNLKLLKLLKDGTLKAVY